MGVIMNYVWRDDRCWLTASSQRPRMAAIRRDNRVSIVISSFGTPLGMQALTYRGRCTIRDDAATKAWFYPALAKRLSPDSSEGQQGFVTMLDTPRRVILEVVPERTVSFDGNRLLSEANG